MYDQVIGYVVSGCLKNNIIVKIYTKSYAKASGFSFVTIRSHDIKYICLVQNISYIVPDSVSSQYDPEVEYLLSGVHEKVCYYQAHLTPLWCIDSNLHVFKAHGLPSHFAPVYKTEKNEFGQITAHISQKDTSFVIGCTQDRQFPIEIPLQTFAKRSNAVFGKTGTGKTFVTKTLLLGILKEDIASLLIFDMHGEYSYQAHQEESKEPIKGLKDLFPEKIYVAELKHSGKQKHVVDMVVEIFSDDIHIDDIIALQNELSLHPTACEAAYLLYTKYKKKWLRVLVECEDIPKLAQEIGAHNESLSALHRKLKRFSGLYFLTFEDASKKYNSSLLDIVELLQKGQSVIIKFGSNVSTLGYLLVANILTRLLYKAYIHKTEESLYSFGVKIKNLIIVIEEAHKFLHPALAKQTTFGIIAREMRKYNISLLIIDQRPSYIDTEIVSQLGTKFLLNLNSDKDIDAAIGGVSNSLYVKSLVGALESKQNMVMIGHVAPFPLSVHIRSYNEDLYRECLASKKNIVETLGKIF